MCRLLESSQAYFSCVRFWRRRKSLCWKRDLGACAFTQKSLATTRLKTRILLLRETCTQVQTILFPMHVHWSTGTGNGRKPRAFSSTPIGFQSEAIYKAHVACQRCRHCHIANGACAMCGAHCARYPLGKFHQRKRSMTRKVERVGELW